MEKKQAILPVIISASRKTDIPAFYSDWLVRRLKEGWVDCVNPYNCKRSIIQFDKTRLIVFWSKNPEPLIKHLDFIEETVGNYYFQFTLNDYEKENLEPKLPSLSARIETFIRLSEKIGSEKVIWRFDPLILTDSVGEDELLLKIENIGNQLIKHTEKLVFSFADIGTYRKVRNNLRLNLISYREFEPDSMTGFARRLRQLNEKWNIEISSCAEEINLEEYRIGHNKCIDDDLIIKLFPRDGELMDYLGVRFSPVGTVEKKKYIKDKGQRQMCGCIKSTDIGAYNSCPFHCSYCYANSSFKSHAPGK